MNVTSPDISTLDFSVIFNIGGAVPEIVINNLSTGPDLASCEWWYTIVTPGGSYIHNGTSTSPDVVGDWSSLIVPDTWPQPFGQIEWSGADYVVTLYVKDSADNIFSLIHQGKICRPNGNTPKTVGNFGVASAVATVRCQDAKLYTEDTTNYSYQGVLGTTTEKKWVLTYPPASDGIAPDPVVLVNFNTGLFDLGYNGPGYYIILNTTRTYDLGDNITVKIQYKFRQEFTVACNVDLCPLICEVDKLMREVDGTCGQNVDAATGLKLAKIAALMGQALIAKQQPLCGIDVAAIVEQIMELGGFSCNCITAGDGINPGGSSNSNINVEFEECGDITANVVNQEGNNITLSIKDFTYEFAVDELALAAGFSWDIDEDTETCTRTVTLQFDGSLGSACQTNIKGLFTHSTTNPITGCPNPIWPKTVWNIADDTAIGTANDITELVAILNADSGVGGWFTTYGRASVVDSCNVSFSCHTGTVTPLIHVEDSGGGPTPCIDQNKTFTTPLQDYDNAGVSLAGISFPGNFYVQYAALGPIYPLGTIATYGALITALNAEPNKPGNLTYTASSGVNPSTINKVIFDVDCDQVDTVTVFEETSSPIVIGSNTDFLVTPSGNTGAEGIDTMSDDELGRVCGILLGSDIIPWNVLKVGNFVYTVGTNVGNMYKIDMTNPVYPVMAATIPLIGGNANAFTGSPNYTGSIPSHWDVYILTGYSDDPQYTYILESTSGNIWKYDLTTDTVVGAFQSNQLIGLCPRIFRAGILFFSWDANRISLTGQTSLNPQYAANNLVYLKVGLGFNNLNIGGIDPGTGLVYALSYDVAIDRIWGTTVDGDLINFQPGNFVAPLAVDTVYSGAWNVAGGYTSLVNTTINGDLIYASSYGKGTKYIDLTTTITPASAIAFDPLSPVSNNHFTFTPIPGKQWGILTYESATEGVAKYSLTGQLISTIPLPGGNIYNVVPFNNTNAVLPNGYC